MSSLFLLFLITSFANIMTPGLGVVMIVMIAAEYGWRRTLPACLGTALGITLLFSVGMSGVGVVVASSPLLFAAIKIAGALFLLWLGVHNWRKPPLKVVENKTAPTQHHDGLFSKCFLLSVTNPQPIIFCVSIFPQFIDAEIAYVPQVTLMIVVYTLMVFVCMVFYALIADRARIFLARGRGPQLLTRVSGTIFILMALGVLYATISKLIVG